MLCYDLRLAQSTPAAVLLQDSHAVTSLAFEDPWLACGSAAGLVGMVNVEDALRSGASSANANGAPRRTPVASLPKPRRQLQGPGGAVNAVDLSSGWLAACGESSTVRTFQFSRCGNSAQPQDARQHSRVWLNGPAASPAVPCDLQFAAAHWAHDRPPAPCGVDVAPTWEPSPENALPAAVARPQRRRHAVLPMAAPQLAVSCRREACAEATFWQIVRPRALIVEKSYHK